MMNIYAYNETEFDNNGFGFLTLIESKITEELNGEYSLSFSIPNNSPLYDKVVEENIVKCKGQLFRIKDINKTLKNTKVYAVHIFYDLLENMVEDIFPKELTCNSMLDWILERTNYPNRFTAYSNIEGIKSARYVRRNPVEIIMGDLENSVINLYNGEIERNNFEINVLNRVGIDNNVKLILGKNIKEIDIKVNTTEQMTRVMPIGFDGLLLPEKYVDSPLIDYNFPKIKKVEVDVRYDPEDENSFNDIEEAYEEMRRQTRELFSVHNVDLPSVSIKVNWVELSKTEEYKNYLVFENVELGDTIHVSLLDMEYTTRVIKVIRNTITDTIEQFELGTFRGNLSYNTTKTMEQLQRKVEQINVTTILEQAKENATNQLTSAMGGYVVKTNNELFIMDTNDVLTAQKVWRWNINGLGYSSRGVNGPYEQAMTSDGKIVADFITAGQMSAERIYGLNEIITNSISINATVKGISDRTAQLKLDVDKLRSEIGDITDITTQEEGHGTLNFENINQSEPINITINPTGNDDISYLYPSAYLFPSPDLYLKNRTLRFKNTTDDTVVDYELPNDLRWLDATTYDEFYLDYGTLTCQITRRVGVNNDLTKYKLEEEIIEIYDYPTIDLTNGNYIVTMLGYPTARMKIRLMSQNMYTSQFATRVEVNSAITQTATEINLTVGYKVDEREVISKINQSAEAIKIQAQRVDIVGVLTAINNDTTTTIDGGKITANSVGVNQVSAQIITTTNLSAQNISATQIKTGTLSADRISGGTINGTNVNITNLSASNIRSGRLNITSGNYYMRMGFSEGNNPSVSGLNVGAYGIKAYSGINATSYNITDSDTGKSVSLQVPRQGGGYYYITFTGGILTKWERH